MSPLSKIKVAISSDFFKAFSAIPHSKQKKVREFIETFKENPTSSGINYEKINQAKDPNLHSVRIDQDYRGIVLKPVKGNVYLLLWADHHDKAYEWAMNKRFQVNPSTGSIQVLTSDINIESIENKTSINEDKRIYKDVREKHLLRFGVPINLISVIKKIESIDELDSLQNILPQEAYEALFYLAAGDSLEEVYSQLDKADKDEKIDQEDFHSALENSDSKRRFYVVEDSKELSEILNAPLEQWRIFLHPTQRKTVNINANGPVRVLGGAGTGKTVVAMHRAKKLVKEIFTGPDDKILFTTFTKNLAADIKENLEKICSPDELRKIEIINIDSWISNFLKKNGYDSTVVFDNQLKSYWQNAMNLADNELELSEILYREEWRYVIQELSVSSLDDYLKVSRIGRGTRLNRIDRKKVWRVFEEYRAQLNEDNLKELSDATRDATIILENKGKVLPYKSIIVDEAQDMGIVTFRLINQMIKHLSKNNLFIVGDSHQRIYGNKVVLGRCGIDIRGRGRKLKINYRTTEEIKKWGVNLLTNKEFDDLDGGIDNQKGYKSLLHGDAPIINSFKNYSDEVSFVKKYIVGLIDNGAELNSICLIARTNDLLLQYEGVIKAENIPTYQIKRNSSDKLKHKGIRLATMHRVKGLEFDHVIITSVNKGILPLEVDDYQSDDIIAKEEHELKERSLLYVAVTRAKISALITSYSEGSEFLN